ncbi:uncharacterized protein BDR25DRAFT_353127 [Lindgomyces ingoldianus]|uniref:Uncharacterized protein n=1 Tax=Lindgomyces ingoldianus TaxID=673940 RepID=A0ACB6R3A2_9PLEO|nr:uncharacterized protein BDR25DRAFT_353127 [Lindgomyces ingoldianus]KAF2472805.1 hypothetical protein BDR25DRAFT_353127 [Lindgomyces ingoldianus]
MNTPTIQQHSSAELPSKLTSSFYEIRKLSYLLAPLGLMLILTPPLTLDTPIYRVKIIRRSEVHHHKSVIIISPSLMTGPYYKCTWEDGSNLTPLSAPSPERSPSENLILIELVYMQPRLKAKENQAGNSSPKPKQPNKTAKWQEAKL